MNDELIRHLSHRGQTGWQYAADHQAIREAGNDRVLWLFRLNHSWSWAIVNRKTGNMEAGRTDWEMTPEQAAQEALEAIRAGGGS